MRAVKFGIVGVAAALVALVVTPVSEAKRRMNPLVEFPTDAERLPAVRYAALDAKECIAELGARHIRYSDGIRTPSIDAPVALEGPLHGVNFEFLYPGAPEKKKNLLDCRLLLALDDLAQIAAEHGIRTVRYNSLFRGRWARKSGARHGAGVAIDITEFVTADDQVWNVLRDFGGHGVGSRTCGDRAPAAAPGKPAELRNFVCAVDRAKIFNLMLTPHYDRRHKNHLHLEVRRKIRWFLTQ
jgi:hypothetical protein